MAEPGFEPKYSTLLSLSALSFYPVVAKDVRASRSVWGHHSVFMLAVCFIGPSKGRAGE